MSGRPQSPDVNATVRMTAPLRVVGIELGTTNSAVCEIARAPGDDGPGHPPVSKANPWSDPIDQMLTAHYGLTDEEVDFIVNYGIKYRLGADVDEE